MIQSYTIRGSAGAGGAGAATATDMTPQAICGRVLSVVLTYNDAPPAGTTDVTVTVLTEGGMPALTLVSRVNSATNITVYPAASLTDNTGTVVTYDGTRPVRVPQPIYGRVQSVIAQANNGDSVDVTIVVDR